MKSSLKLLNYCFYVAAVGSYILVGTALAATLKMIHWMYPLVVFIALSLLMVYIIKKNREYEREISLAQQDDF